MDPAVAAKNLQSIQRIDPCAEAILDKATHTALYRFNNDSRVWEKTDVDGAMFIYQRVDAPYYSLMIANRQSPNDMIEPITSSIRIKIDLPYLFFCKPEGEIRGLWFYKETDCHRIFQLMERILNDLKQGKDTCDSLIPISTEVNASPTPPPQPPSLSTDEANSILSMLRAAQSGATRKQSQGSSPAPPPTTSAPTTQTVNTMQVLTNSSASAANAYTRQPTPPSAQGGTELPVMLQKLFDPTQNAPSSKASVSGVTADDLEKDLLRTARARLTMQEFVNSPSAASLQAFSTLSVHGSEDLDPQEIESVRSVGGRADDSVMQEDQEALDVPALDKEQFGAAIQHLLSNNDEFLSMLHQAYIDALNKKFRIGGSEA